ncbi:RagB/SusD family nutrient uptake outer membrane protein [Larkinella humicola]|uniref:RagB/SusD family nutrient uptake outer membrane protein n=1 Tax=Larkinella humicola TaxID=2607654 RepID=A0A5N1JJQ4_9BACT|nr:RagB/SusD family nutrient uptake outer membrane protein [Larkinella humicola]KAA9353593.1 RagB/SusD family nutrient uptake outer membrane protein [Larkinella humicola]
MKRSYLKPILTGCLVSLLSLSACTEEYLEKQPIGSISESTLANKSGIKGVLIGAYSLLDGVGATGGSFWSSPTVLSSMASSDAHVGTEPNGLLASYEAYTHDPTSSSTNERWQFLYAAVQRTNDVLRLLPKVTELTADEAAQMKAEAIFLRAVYHFEAAKLWRNVPFVDESIGYDAGNYNVSNTDPIWPKIEADFKYAADNLTPTKSDVGRANKWAAKAFLAKVYLFQQKFTEAKPLLAEIIASGVTSNGKKYALAEQYADNFRTDKKHGPEAVFTVQMSVYDGANGANGNAADMYNGPFGGPPSCCYGWLQPSFDLVNSYQTDANGLPMIDTYNNNLVTNDQGLQSSAPFTPYAGTLDSRLDWVVGRRGIPYLDWGIHPGMAWIRQQNTGGPYSVIKNIAWQARIATDRENANTNNPYSLIRFADVLLWAAEVEVEVGSLAQAEIYVNQIRARAANPAGFVKKYIDNAAPLKGFTNEPAANYKVGLYSGQFVQKGKEFAREAVRFERKLELALEHHRFFDLQRYDNGTGYMATYLNKYLKYEAAVPKYFNQDYMKGAFFTKGKNELYPIPQAQIDLSTKDGKPTLKQNPGY